MGIARRRHGRRARRAARPARATRPIRSATLTADGELTVGALLAIGRTAEVYEGDSGSVVKVFRAGWSDDEGEFEARAATVAHRAGVGAPAVLGTGRVDGRYAIAYERRDGRTMLEALVAGPWTVPAMARAFAERHVAMHDATGTELPALREALHDAVDGAAPVAEPRLRDPAHRRIDDLPDGRAICHGDYHPANLVLADGGPAVIDWVTAAAGPPEADVARTLFLIRDSGLPPELPLGRRVRIVALRHTFSVAYGRAYRERRALDPAAVRGWRLPILVARLSEGIAHERARLRRSIEREVTES